MVHPPPPHAITTLPLVIWISVIDWYTKSQMCPSVIMNSYEWFMNVGIQKTMNVHERVHKRFMNIIEQQMRVS